MKIPELVLSAIDSIYHALCHTGELTSDNNNKEKEHHRRWMVIGVQNAAELFLKQLLSEIDPANPILRKPRKGGGYIDPRCSDVVSELKAKSSLLKSSEVALVNLMEHVNGLRNILVHHSHPGKIDSSNAAWAALALIRAISIRYNVKTEEIYNQEPPIETDLVSMLRFDKNQDYESYVYAVMSELYPDRHSIEQCPNCGIESVIDGKCEGCFQRMLESDCIRCEERIIFPENFVGIEPKICWSCNARQD